MSTSLPIAYAFLLTVFRALGLTMSAPSLSSTLVPVRIRVAIGVVLGGAAFAGAGFPPAPLPEHFLMLVFDGAVQTSLGLAAGWAVRGVLEAASGAGTLAGSAMGFHYGAMINPASGGETNALSQVFSVLALASAMALGLHRELVVWLCHSLQVVPIGQTPNLGGLVGAAVAQILLGWAFAVRLAFPLLTAVTLGHLALGLMGRSAPQFGLGNLGFSVALLSGGGALYLIVPSASEAVARAAVAALGGG